MIMNRDLFNLFLFLEIVSIATYGLLSLRQTPEALSATFKYLMATVLASGFFLIGTMLAYAVTGLLNIDDLIAQRSTIIGPLGFAAVIFVLACLLLELKPFPANGWGLDVYETARSDVAAMISGGVSAGVFFALLKLLPLFENQLTLIAAMGAITFVFSNLIGLQQDKAQRLLGYSSIGQMGLLTIAAALLQRQGAESAMLLVIGGLFVNHLFAKVGLFWLAGYVEKEHWRDWSVLAGRPDAILLFGILVVAICGLPPFPGFWAKWRSCSPARCWKRPTCSVGLANRCTARPHPGHRRSGAPRPFRSTAWRLCSRPADTSRPLSPASDRFGCSRRPQPVPLFTDFTASLRDCSARPSSQSCRPGGSGSFATNPA
jgi:formate hydrogenlyase subunit 3/multisubunit Na+/H+ antiporter MnhD subunit